MAYPQQNIPFDEYLNYVNSQWITNGNGDIVGVTGNNVVNALYQYIIRSTVNWELSAVVDTDGAYTLVKPVTVFVGSTPSSVSWGNNFYNEFYIVNATGFAIPLADGVGFYDEYLDLIASITPRTILHIGKATNGNWFKINNTGGGSGAGLPPQSTHAGQFLGTNGDSANWADTVIDIASADFEADGSTYLNAQFANNQPKIFLNNINRYLVQADGEWDYVYDGDDIIGINITAGGFDASTDNKYLVISFGRKNTVPVVGLTEITGNGGGEVDVAATVYFGGNGTVTDNGFCWSLNPNPTIADNSVSAGSGTGAIEANISPLDVPATYYIRAYATNEYGTGYGAFITFETGL